MNRSANALAGLGLPLESRLMVTLLDTIDFPAVFLGAIKAGLVPIAANTLLTTNDFNFILRDSRAQATWCSPRPNCFSPTAWATRSAFRCPSAPSPFY